MQMVIVNFELPKREADWLCESLINQLTSGERIWLADAQELGHSAELHSALEKVTGTARCAYVRVLCTQERAGVLLEALNESRHPDGVHWQIVPLLGSGTLGKKYEVKW